ncbi:MAG: ORF6C domain-containing protein [Campylobacter sp.]|nr:ORF6C domain-containing protein [Campylobacter sp.]
MKTKDEEFEDYQKKFLDIIKKRKISIKGNSNTIISGDNNTITQNINPIIKKPPIIIAPDERHITNEQQFKIKSKIDDIVKKDIEKGVEAKKAYPRIWNMFKRKFKLTSYKELEKEKFDEAMQYLNKINSMKLSQIRRTNNPSWRKELYKSIYSKANELGLSKYDLYNLVYEKYNKKIKSLKDLGEQNLVKLKSYLFSIK